jgi:hypothetical protein
MCGARPRSDRCTAFTRARLQTRFYVCEPEIDSEHAHEPAGAERTALEAIEAVLERSQAQLMAHDLAERDQVMLGVTVASASHAAS